MKSDDKISLSGWFFITSMMLFLAGMGVFFWIKTIQFIARCS